MSDLQEAREFFSHDRYATKATGIVIEEVGEGYARCSLALNEDHKNAVGHVMGGVMFTLADFVFAVATNFRQPPTVTVSSQISYLASPKGTILYGESKKIKDGKRNCFYQVTVTDDLGTQVALITVCGAHLAK